MASRVLAGRPLRPPIGTGPVQYPLRAAASRLPIPHMALLFRRLSHERPPNRFLAAVSRREPELCSLTSPHVVASPTKLGTRATRP